MLLLIQAAVCEQGVMFAGSWVVGLLLVLLQTAQSVNRAGVPQGHPKQQQQAVGGRLMGRWPGLGAVAGSRPVCMLHWQCVLAFSSSALAVLTTRCVVCWLLACAGSDW